MNDDGTEGQDGEGAEQKHGSVGALGRFHDDIHTGDILSRFVGVIFLSGVKTSRSRAGLGDA